MHINANKIYFCAHVPQNKGHYDSFIGLRKHICLAYGGGCSILNRAPGVCVVGDICGVAYVWIITQPAVPAASSILQGTLLISNVCFYDSFGIAYNCRYQSSSRTNWEFSTYNLPPVYCDLSMMTSSNGNIFPGEFHAQRPMTRSFYAIFDLRLNKRLSKQ